MPDFIRDIGEIRCDHQYGPMYGEIMVSNSDVAGIVDVDGWPAGYDDDAQGTTLCRVVCTRHGDIVFMYTDEVYRSDPRVIEAANQASQDLLTDFDDFVTVDQKKCLELFEALVEGK